MSDLDTSQWKTAERRRPRTTWRRTFQADLALVGIRWEEAEDTAPDRSFWRQALKLLPYVPYGIGGTKFNLQHSTWRMVIAKRDCGEFFIAKIVGKSVPIDF